MAEETKPQEKEAKKSTLGERMSDVGGMRVFRDGKWILLSELSKKKPEQKKEEAPAQKEEKKPVVASSYLQSVLKASGGSGAPAEVLDMDKIEDPGPSGLSVQEVFSKAPVLVQDDLKEKIKEMGDSCTEEYLNISDLTPTQDYLDDEKLEGAEDNTKPITVFRNDSDLMLVDGHHRCASKFSAGQNKIKANVYSDVLTATAGSKPAPKKDQIKGSNKNAKGSAASGRKITFSKAVEASLKEKVESHNKSVSADGKRVTLSMLKAVYRRGAGAFSTSHRPDQNRNSWAMGRVNAFLHLVKSGSPSNSKYTTDNDLLPKSHAKSTRASIVASAFEDDNYESELSVVLLPESEYTSKEQALLALAEYSGLGYESIPAMNAAWIRGEKAGQNGFDRASELAIGLYESPDSDLLPKEF
jgi:hypothetical protein